MTKMSFEWLAMNTAPENVTIEEPVLFLARVIGNYDVKAKNHQIWMPVVGYGSKREGWKDALLDAGQAGRKEIELEPVKWARIPMPLPYPPRP
jgi:hypothetical protein